MQGAILHGASKRRSRGAVCGMKRLIEKTARWVRVTVQVMLLPLVPIAYILERTGLATALGIEEGELARDRPGDEMAASSGRQAGVKDPLRPNLSALDNRMGRR